MHIYRHLCCLAVAAIFCASAEAQQFTISTFAGTGTAGFAGDSGSATSAQLMSPDGIFIDSSGKLYIADSGNHRVRMVSGGTITTIAGTGTLGYSGDGKAATSAQLNGPTSVAVDSSGNVYIADAGNDVIRKISSGNISTIVGNASLGPGYSGDTAAATSAQLNDPVGIALDGSGNLYIADTNNNVIRLVTASTGIITTVVGGAATFLQLNHPTGIALDSSGSLYIADTGNRRIVKFSAGAAASIGGNGTPVFSGDNGPALKAGIDDPTGVAVDSAGNVYITDTFSSRIRRITADGTITTIAGNGRFGYTGDNGPAIGASLNFPRALTTDSSGNIYIADSSNNVIRQLKPLAPSISNNGVVNAGSFTAAISPGSLASIFGTNFAGGNGSATTTPLPFSLGNVTVTVNGRNAPILFVSAGQINFQIPWETAPGSAKIVVSNGLVSNSVTVNILSASPGLFTTTAGRAIVQNSDFSLNSPSNPAKGGLPIVAYLTGSGPVDQPITTGAVSPTNPVARVTSPTSATIGPASAQVVFAGLTPGFVGLVQMNITVPTSLPSGDYPLTVTIGGQSSNSGTVSVKN